MSVIDTLIESANSDNDLLKRLDADGDHFENFRMVDFHFKCPDQDKAAHLATFLTDHKFGDAKVQEEGLDYYVNVKIYMPISQQVILCVSGFMTCLAEVYQVKMDGWGCSIPR